MLGTLEVGRLSLPVRMLRSSRRPNGISLPIGLATSLLNSILWERQLEEDFLPRL